MIIKVKIKRIKEMTWFNRTCTAIQWTWRDSRSRRPRYIYFLIGASRLVYWCTHAPSPRHKPLCGSPLAPRWQRSPLMWSQGWVALQSWLNCLAHTLQQPHESSTELIPGRHKGGDEGHEHLRWHSPWICKRGTQRTSIVFIQIYLQN